MGKQVQPSERYRFLALPVHVEDRAFHISRLATFRDSVRSVCHRVQWSYCCQHCKRILCHECIWFLQQIKPLDPQVHSISILSQRFRGFVPQRLWRVLEYCDQCYMGAKQDFGGFYKEIDGARDFNPGVTCLILLGLKA